MWIFNLLLFTINVISMEDVGKFLKIAYFLRRPFPFLNQINKIQIIKVK